MTDKKLAKQKMTAAEAKSFEHGPSQTNATVVETTFTCGCQAYVSVFTYGRWQAQGFQVRRGEKGTKIATYRSKEVTDKDSGKSKKIRFPKTTFVFCQCQVDKKEA